MPLIFILQVIHYLSASRRLYEYYTNTYKTNILSAVSAEQFLLFAHSGMHFKNGISISDKEDLLYNIY